jgi:hypothetical protein
MQPSGTDVIAPASQSSTRSAALRAPSWVVAASTTLSRFLQGKGTARLRGRGRMQTLHAHLVQQCVSMRIQWCRVRGLQG